jgi:ATP-dependent DNA ligase
VVYDVSVLAGVDLRPLSWQDRRQRLELLAQALDVLLELSPLIQPSTALVHAMQDGRLEGIVLKEGTAPYRDGSPLGWHKVKDRSWYEREGWRFDRHG